MEAKLNAPPERDDVAFLAPDPPPWAARGLGYLILFLFAAALAGAIAIRVPETVSCAFTLEPVEGTDPIRASCDGFVVAVHVAEAQTVAKDEPLFAVRSPHTGERSVELSSLEIQLAGARESLVNARQRFARLDLADEAEAARLHARSNSLVRRIEATKKLHTVEEETERGSVAIGVNEIESLERELKYRQKVQVVTKQLATQGARLAESKALSNLEQLRIQLEADRGLVDAQQTDRDLTSARLRRDRLTAQHAARRAERSLALDQLETEQRDADALLGKLGHQRNAAAREFAEQERSLKELIDRCGIRIASLRDELDRSRGTFVRTGDVLCELAGPCERLQADLQIPQMGAGRVAAQQGVKLLYDAFPYQRFGVRNGTVRWVSPAGVDTFRALVDVEDESVHVDGRDSRLVPGMGGRADVVVGRRSLISYAFEPLRQLRENLADAPQARPVERGTPAGSGRNTAASEGGN
jgi:multidrug efflux pump subunit AcrA (membrane-fusion protein)